jgi:uncharacterized caspase-like protein
MLITENLSMRGSAMKTVFAFVTGLVMLTCWTELLGQAQQDSEALPAKRNIQVTPARAGQKWVFLVGSNHYYDRQLSHLSYCQDDVKAMEKYVVKYAGVPENHIILLHDNQPDPSQLPIRINIEQTLEDFVDKPGPDDQVIVVFSLHGLFLEGTSYLCPMEAERTKPESSLVSVDRVYQLLDRCRAAQKIVILDACRKSLRKPTRAAEDEQAMTRAFAEGIRRVPRGIWVLFSCGVEQVSYEDRGLRHGVFMNFILDGLTGRADKQGGNGDGKVDLRELFQFAKAETSRHVFGRFRGEQLPEMKGDQEEAAKIVLSQVGPVHVEVPPGPDPFESLRRRPLEEAQRMKVARVKSRTAVQYAQDGERYMALDSFREATELVKKVVASDMKDEVLGDIAKDQADAKEFRLAAKTCETIEDKRLQCMTVCEIAKSQAKGGDIPGAKDTMDLFFSPNTYAKFSWGRVFPKEEFKQFDNVLKEALEFIKKCESELRR